MNQTSVLIVEDDPHFSKLIVSSLRSRGYEAEPVETVAEGVDYLRHHRPALILLDIVLPDQPGWALLESSAVSGRPPVVVLSALDPDPAQVSRYQPLAYLQKPFGIPELLRVVRGAVG